MFSGNSLDFAIGIVFVFLAVSLAVSTMTEALASAMKWRSKTLLQGIKELFNDPEGQGLARELYNHALVNPRSDGRAPTADKATAKPAYIDPRQFADAVVDILQSRGPGIASDPQIRELLSGMLTRAGADPNALKAELAAWFDQAMDRVSGVYKRWAQLCNFLIAFAVAAVLNVDMLRVAAYLYEQPGITRQITAVNQTPAQAQQSLDQLGLPVGWFDQSGKVAAPHLWVSKAWDSSSVQPDGSVAGWDLAGRLVMGLGWLLTALGAMFGAPFWFDMLKRFVSLRGTGPATDEKPKPVRPAAAPPALAPVSRPMLLAGPLALAPRISGKAAAIIAVCEQEWPGARSDCSLFVRNVAAQFGVTLTGTADQIVGQIQTGNWVALADGVAAEAAAAAGKLVIAGLAGADQQTPSAHGHVVVVIAGRLAEGRYPSAYWGRLGSIGARNTTINFAWRAGDRDNVIYASYT